jgi:hypothetical protein
MSRLLTTNTSSARCCVGVSLAERTSGRASDVTVVNLRNVLGDCRLEKSARRGHPALSASEEVLQ